MKILAIILGCLAAYVNPFVGTDGHGHTFPGACYPFGMVQLSPDTRPKSGDWDGCSGYHYSDTLIYGFSHTHLSGTGCDDLCDILLMPGGAPSVFSHSREKASPGYYEVFLEGPQVLARMTVGERTGMHEYTFPEGRVPEIRLDLGHRDRLLESWISVEGNTVRGLRKSSSWSQDQDVYFFIEFSGPVESFENTGRWVNLRFAPTAGNTISARVGISSVSALNAEQNIASDRKYSFEALRRRAGKAWNGFLSKCRAPRGADREVFYTALYHCAIHPSLYSDANGEYRGMDREVHKAEGWKRYTVFSLWDTFRGLHPLLCMIEPDRTVDFLKSFLSIYREAGKLPVWELWGWETNCMIGYNSAPVIADVVSRGMVDGKRLTVKDIEDLFEALLVSSKRGEFGMDSFRRNGLVLADDEHESVSKTLEYAYDDWCVARVAGFLGREKEYREYMTSAQYWRNVFDPSTGFMRPRLNGRWLSPFNPREVNNHFTEANSWQYSFFVPQDIASLIDAHGGPGEFEKALDALFEAPQQTTGRTQADITGLIGQYAHGNEPSHHVALLYDYVGAHAKAVAMRGRIMNELYTAEPDGLCGNDDCGQMSAWYVLNALGCYPVTPGAAAGEMTRIPQTIVVNPVFEMRNDIFEDTLSVSIGNVQEGARAWYSVDGSDFIPYEKPFIVTRSSTLRAFSAMPDGKRSFTTESRLRKVLSDRTLTISSRYNRQYNAGGDNGLIDGYRGPLNWRTGGWQGYQDTDFEAVVDLKAPRELTRLGAGFCQDARSWIWMPRYVEFSVSDDGENFKMVSRKENTVEEDDMKIQVWDCTADIKEKARYVKVFAKNIGAIPEWHPGAGSPGFIFIDEIWTE